ncbi:type IV pilin protein [Roseateles saccharophilus]|uniref:Type IV pilus assembly protein PilE n=1 Tax=Roseateles saccharophilus TaxID=304 RepID=A0A4R3UNI5_ROSSA|nr:type IV pilin protein [Roseateles saccharophilus]MDG0833658.1 prepilin-type N-terminal cleavage/methylation domain-containing protein [Roseateles saccharophilus]TCU93245.1 type IV pilus assembly protein PilE [Roseateles saccharophilus]
MNGIRITEHLECPAENPSMRQPLRRARQGFTLIELMVAVVIVGILAAVAYPAYTSFVQRGRRADAMAVLTAVVQAQERYRANNSAYASSLDALNVDASAITSNYDVSTAGVGNPASLVSGYVVTAAINASGRQKNDTVCAQMSVQLDGAKLQYLAYDTTNADTRLACWGR